MLTTDGCAARRRRLWAALDEKPDWILIGTPQHLVYFAGYFPSPFFFNSVNAGAMLILGADGSSVLVADNLTARFAEAAHVDAVVAPVWYRGVESAGRRDAQLVATLLDQMKTRPGAHIGYESYGVPAGVVEGLRAERGSLRLTTVDATIHPLKRSKDPDEMELIGRSMRAGEAGHGAALREVRPGMTELEVYRFVADAAMRAASDRVLVYGDFVSGSRCEAIGGPPTDRVIGKGDLVLLDFSVVVGGYRGDFANPFVCGASPTGEQRRLYDACMEAMRAGEARVRSGEACREIDQTIRANLDAANMPTHSGHGMGLGHPDPPFLVPESTDTLVDGDVIAIEPGQYVEGVGGMRFERNYRVTRDGYELLSHHALQIEQAG